MTTAVSSPRTDPVPLCASDSVAASHTLIRCAERERRTVSTAAAVHTACQLATQLIEKTSPRSHAEPHLVPNGRAGTVHHKHTVPNVHSCQQKSIGLKFPKSQTGSDVWYSCHHNSSRFTFPIFAHSCRFSVLRSLQSITPRIY